MDNSGLDVNKLITKLIASTDKAFKEFGKTTKEYGESIGKLHDIVTFLNNQKKSLKPSLIKYGVILIIFICFLIFSAVTNKCTEFSFSQITIKIVCTN